MIVEDSIANDGKRDRPNSLSVQRRQRTHVDAGDQPAITAVRGASETKSVRRQRT